MATAERRQRELLTCVICLDLLREPLTLGCGHNYCTLCINTLWDQQEAGRLYRCPQCRRKFYMRPCLGKNTVLAELAEQVRSSRDEDVPLREALGGAEEVEGHGEALEEGCTEAGDPQTCLQPLPSHTETHTTPHQQQVTVKKPSALPGSTDTSPAHSPGHVRKHNPAPNQTLGDLDTAHNHCPAVSQAFPTQPVTREDFLHYSCHLTLDPDTAYRHLQLSVGKRMVERREESQCCPPHPDRFDGWDQVLCREPVSERSYWEVEWSGVVALAVSYRGISRKGRGPESGYGCNDQSWRLKVSGSSCSFWHNGDVTPLPLVADSRIGVYVDHRAGILAFYRVSDTMTLLHRVHTTFTNKLYAGFGFFAQDSAVKLLLLSD